MKVPKLDRHYRHHVRCGLYTHRQLVRLGLGELAQSIQTSTQQVLALGRAQEDASFKTVERYADRDACDVQTDTLARKLRHQLASRDVQAEKKAPYTAIFPEGIGWYTKAPLDSQVERYRTLASRCRANLAADDAIVTGLVPELEKALASWEEAVSALIDRQSQETLARDALLQAVETWTKGMNDAYSTLCIQESKAWAEGFFLKEF